MCYVGGSLNIRNEERDKSILSGKEWKIDYVRKLPSPGTEGGKFWIRLEGNLGKEM